MSLKVGIIGFGRIGAEHARWISQAKGATATHVFDPTTARRELAVSRGLIAVDELDDLLADSSIDAVLISTPTSMHCEHASRALAMGKHVMVEKPMALDLAQARKLVQAADGARRVLTVFHNRRWDIDYLTVKQAVEGRRFGRVINVESRICQWASCVGPAAKEFRPNWRNEGSFGGGGLYDWGSHLIDQLWRLFWPAKPASVFAQLRGNVWSNDCDDFARVCINFDSGPVGLIEINTTTMHPLPRWHMDGTLGSAESSSDPSYDTRRWADLKMRRADGSSESTLPLAPAGLSEADIWTRFAAAIDGHGLPAVPVQTVLPTMCLLDAARESSRDGTSVDVRDRCQWVL